MAGCKEIIKSVGFHIETLVWKPVYSREFALYHVLSNCFTVLNFIPSITLRFKCKAFSPKIPVRNLNMNGPVFAGYSCLSSQLWVALKGSGSSGAAFYQILLNKIISDRGGNLSSFPLGFSSLEDPVITAAHGASPAGNWWKFRNKIKLVFVFWSL